MCDPDDSPAPARTDTAVPSQAGAPSYPASLNRRAPVPASVEDTVLAAPSVAPAPAHLDTTLLPISGAEATMHGSSDPREQARSIARRVAPRSQLPLKIGRYLVIGQLGEGGMGVVFAAYDPQLDRKVAIKLVRPAYTESSGGEAQARLVREAQALARLRHPNIVTVYEVGTYGDEVYVAMEFVDGVTLRTWQFEHARTWREIVRVYQAAGRGLAAAHRGGLVHRDFKPDNVLVTRDGEARVLDFGLAFRSNGPAAPTAGAAPRSDSLTMTGALVGTPAYMSPEQHRGAPTDARTDVFSFSVALFEALYGVRPYAGSNAIEICASMFAGQVSPPPPFIKIPAWLRRVVLRGLKIEAGERTPDMDTMVRALGRDPLRWLAAASVVLVVGGVITALVLALQTAEGRQSLRDRGARARADFDHARALALEAALARRDARGPDERFNDWVVGVARARLEHAPAEALAALKHLRPGAGDLTPARAVAVEALARGMPTLTWPTSAAVTRLTFADGDHVLTGDAGGHLELRARTDAALRASAVHTPGRPITDLAVALATTEPPARKDRPPLRVAALTDGELLLWDLATDLTRRQRDPDAAILAVALAPTGDRFVTGDAAGRVRLYDWAGALQASYIDHPVPVRAVAWSADGAALASGDEQGRVISWNLAAGNHRELGKLGAAVDELRFTADPPRLHAITTEHAGTVWSLAPPEAKPQPVPGVMSLRLVGSTRLLLDAHGGVALDFERAPDRPLHVGVPVRALAIAPDERWAAVGHAHGVEIWDARPRRRATLPQVSRRLARLLWSPDGRWLAGASDDGALTLWSVADQRRTTLQATGPMIQALVFGPAGDALFVVDRGPRIVRWDLSQDPPVALPLPAVGSGTAHLRARGLADGGLVQWHHSDFGTDLQAFTGDGQRRWVEQFSESFAHVHVSPDGRRVVLAPPLGPARIYRVEHDSLVREPLDLGDARHRWRAIAHTPDGARTRLAATLDAEPTDAPARFVIWDVAWDPQEGDPPTPHVLHEDDSVRAALVDDSGEAVIVSDAGGDHLWQLASTTVDRLPPCIDRLQGLAIAPDRRHVALVGSARVSAVSETVCLVDLDSGAVARLPSSGDPWAWDGGRRLASVYQGTEVELWTDPTPADPAALPAWLAQQTPLELPLAALQATPTRAR